MRKKIMIIMALLLLGGAASLFAGDIAEFINLGFSEEGKYFLFGQYGYDPDNTRSYAELYLVDVKRNSFVANGVHKGAYGAALEPGQAPDGALFTLFREIFPQLDHYGIQHVRKGRPLYIRIADNSDGVNLNFRDFETGWQYEISLNQTVIGEGGNVESSFYLDVKRSRSGAAARTYQVGLPDYRRDGVSAYTIERILLAPDEASLVFVIAKTIYDGDDPDIRYMVETLTP